MTTWTHTDPFGIWFRGDEALARSVSTRWLEGGQATLETRGAELRALIFRTAWSARNLALAGKPIPPATNEFIVDGISPGYPSATHKAAADAVLGWIPALAGGKAPLQSNFETRGGAAPITVEGWPILVAKVVGSAIWALAACYIAERYESTFDRWLERRADTDRLLALTAAATAMVDAHTARELAAGQSLPFTGEEVKIVDASLDAQKKILAKPGTPPDSHPALGSGIGSFSTGALFALAVGGYFLLRGKQ